MPPHKQLQVFPPRIADVTLLSNTFFMLTLPYYFNKFLKQQDIACTNVETNFEKFINYICLNSKNISNFNLIAAYVGSGNDAGIDGIAISINNRFVSDMTELKTILNIGMEFTGEKLILAIENDENFIQLLGYAKKCIDSVIKNIGDTEANKTVSIVNQLLLYSEIEWNKNEINQAIYFNNMIDNYLIPFKNMKIDGDMRYKFNKNFSYLKSLINDNIVAKKLINRDVFVDVENNIDENNRDSRKLNSIKICDELFRINK